MAPTESQTQKLISLYRSCECLWNPQSPGYRSGSVQDDAWRKITRGMNSGLTPDQVKLRVLALRNYYDKECAAIRRNQQKGYSYVPRHSYFKDLLFLGDMQCGETEESKASFCMGQLNCILEDSFILSENNSIKTDYPQNYSGATLCQYTASLGNRSNESKPAYTLYKLILEPEKPSPSREKVNGKLLEKSNERSTSGNDRWYPTTYCVRCDKAKCSGKRQSRISESGCSSSMDQSGCGCPNREQDQEICSCSSETESEASCKGSMDSQKQRPCPRTHNDSDGCVCKDSQRQRPSPRTHNDSGGCGCSQNRAARDEWPGPKLCGQTRCQAAPKCRRVKKCPGPDKSCCLGNWKRNNDAVCKRLQAQMGGQNEEGACSRKPRTSTRPCSGEDQMNGMLVKNNCPRNGNSQSSNCQAPMDSARFNNNQQIPDAGRYGQPGPDPVYYNNNQQMQDPGPYINNQQMQNPGPYTNNQPMQDPGRYANDPQGRPIYQDVMCPSYAMPAGPTNYYQTQQFGQSPTNYSYSGPPPNSMVPGQQYVEAEYVPCQLVNEYGRSAYPEQQSVYCYAPETPNNWGQLQPRAPAAGQMPMVPSGSTCDFQDSRPHCKAPCAYAGPTDLDNRYPADTRRYPEQQPTVRRRQQDDDDIASYPVDDPRERPTRRRYQNQGGNTYDDQDIQRSRRNDFDRDQRRQYRADDREDSAPRTRDVDYMEGPVKRGREYGDESPTRRRHRNEDLEERYFCDDQYCPWNRQRNDYEEAPAGGRQRTAENPDSYYKNPPSQKETRDLETQTPWRTDKTIFSKYPPPEKRKKRRNEEAPLESESQEDCQPCGLPFVTKNGKQDEPEEIECPAYNRQNPSECPKYPPPEKRKKRRKEEEPLESESQDCEPCGLPFVTRNDKRDEPEEIECPGYNRQNPRESPNLTYKRQQKQDRQDRSRQDRSRQDREERIARKTKPPARNREYEDDEDPSPRSRGGPPPEESQSEDEKISSPKEKSRNRPNEETNKPKRRDDDNYCNDERCNVTLRPDKDRSDRRKDRSDRRKDRQDRDVESGNVKYKSLKSEVMQTFCTEYTCPYMGKSTSELGAVPKDRSRKQPSKDPNEPTKKKRRESYDDEWEEKKIPRNETSTKKRTTDDERHKKGKSKKKDVDDCECESDDNNYDQRRNRKDDRSYDTEPDERSPQEKYNKYPPRDDRNESYRNNKRSQRGYPRENGNRDDDYDSYDNYRGTKNMNDCVDCPRSIDTYDTMKETSNRNYRGREESRRNRQKNKDYEESEYERNSRRTNSPKRNQDNVAPKKESKSKGTDVYESEYDCPCSDDEFNPKDDRNPPQSRSPQRGKTNEREPNNDRKKDYNQERSRDNKTDVDSVNTKTPTQNTKPRNDEFNPKDDRNPSQSRSPRRGRNDEREPNNGRKKDYNQERSRDNETDVDTVNTDTSPQNTKPRKYRNDQSNPEDATKDDIQERTDIDDKEGNEYGKKPNKVPATKNDSLQDYYDCEPELAASPNRNPAGNGSFPLNEPLEIPFKDMEMEPAPEPPSKTNSDNKPLKASNKLMPEEPKVVDETVSAEQASPKKKKKTSPGGSGLSKSVKSSKLKSRSASPTRSSVPPKTQAGEPAKKRCAPRSGASPSPYGRQIGHSGAKRTTDTSAAANSKLPFDLNSASYFICKLQDDGNTHQYLVVVPKDPTGRPERHREDPGQGSVKQLHCQRQSSGFQSVSWVNPASACQSESLPSTEDVSELSSSVAPPSLTDTTLRIVKEYLQKSMMQGIQTVAPAQRMLNTVLSGPRRRRPVLRASSKANAAILAENRTLLLTNNPFENLSLADNGGDVIVLHPPVPGFRPSKNSFNKDAVEVERITIRGSDTDVTPRPTPAAPLLPPRPPTKPKRK